MIGHFTVYRNSDRADRGHRHQQALIKWLTVLDSLKCFDQNIIANHQIWNQIENESQRPAEWQKIKSDQQSCRNQDSDQHFFLFFIHMSFLPLAIYL